LGVSFFPLLVFNHGWKIFEKPKDHVIWWLPSLQASVFLFSIHSKDMIIQGKIHGHSKNMAVHRDAHTDPTTHIG
jgi:hypothetical protein